MSINAEIVFKETVKSDSEQHYDFHSFRKFHNDCEGIWFSVQDVREEIEHLEKILKTPRFVGKTIAAGTIQFLRNILNSVETE